MPGTQPSSALTSSTDLAQHMPARMFAARRQEVVLSTLLGGVLVSMGLKWCPFVNGAGADWSIVVVSSGSSVFSALWISNGWFVTGSSGCIRVGCCLSSAIWEIGMKAPAFCDKRLCRLRDRDTLAFLVGCARLPGVIGWPEARRWVTGTSS